MIESSAIERLASQFRAREIDRVVYFHCDHFEPWASFGERTSLDERHIEDLINFVDDLDKIDYARRLTLFYKSFFRFRLDDSPELIRSSPEDRIGFVPRSDLENRICSPGLKNITDNSGHEIQIHLHHESYTRNTRNTDPAIAEFLASEQGIRTDGPRFAVSVEMAKDTILQETGVALNNWHFVHGQWALNGSDVDVCMVEDEIERLMRAGCVADFTFPAGRAHVDPRPAAPYFCDPIRALRGYDLDEASPEPAYGNAHAAKTKFFIWSSEIKHVSSSLDYYAEWVRNKLESPEQWAMEIIKKSFVADGNLFFKTHAHSMARYYREDKRRPVYPHAHPGVQTLCCMVFDAAQRAGADVEFLTSSEVYDLFCSAKVAPAPNGFAAPPTAVVQAERTPCRQAVDLEHLNDLVQPSPEGSAADDASLRANEIATSVVRDRIAELGEYESGAYNYYGVRADRGRVLETGERSLVRLLARLPSAKLYVEVGSGVGALTLAIALTGRCAVGVDVDRRRHATAEAVLNAAQGTTPRLLCKFFLGPFPEALEQIDLKNAFGLVTNFVATMSQDEKEAVIRGLCRFDRVLIDLDRFIERRQTSQERAELLASLQAHGLEPHPNILDLGDHGRYALLTAVRSARADSCLVAPT